MEEYEYTCEECGGLGLVKRKYEEFEVVTKSTTCPKCLGDGKLDFIENITGKKTKSFVIIPDDNSFDGIVWKDGGLYHPPNPTKGDAYFDQIKNNMFVYDGNSWVEIPDSVIGGEII